MSPCQGCHAGCCRSFAIPITGADVLRIELDRRLEFPEFACRWADPEGTIASGVVPHFHFADEPETPFAICLRHEASAIFTRTTKCIFLEEGTPTADAPLGESRCGIYGQRPLPCRIYPTRWNASGELVELHGVPAYGRSNDPHPIYGLCGRPWELSDIDPIAGVQQLVVLRYELDFFAKVAAMWNRACPEFELFPQFLREVYLNRVVREEAQTVTFALPATLPGPFGGWIGRAA